jgi:hypothetical protein
MPFHTGHCFANGTLIKTKNRPSRLGVGPQWRRNDRGARSRSTACARAASAPAASSVQDRRRLEIGAEVTSSAASSTHRKAPAKPSKSDTRSRRPMRAVRSIAPIAWRSVDEGGLRVLRDLVLDRRARKTGGAIVDGGRREPAGLGAIGAAAVHQVREIQRERLRLSQQVRAADPGAERVKSR